MKKMKFYSKICIGGKMSGYWSFLEQRAMGNWVLVPWKVVKGISDDLRHALVIF